MCVQWRVGFQLLIWCFHDEQNSQRGGAIGKGLGRQSSKTDVSMWPTVFRKAGRGLGRDQGPRLQPFCASQVHGWPPCHVNIPVLAGENQVILMSHQLRTLWPSISSNHACRDLASLWNVPSEESPPQMSWLTNKYPLHSLTVANTELPSALTPYRQGLYSVLRDDSVRPGKERRKSRWTGLGVGPLCGHHGRLLERAQEMQWEPETPAPKAVRRSVMGDFVQKCLLHMSGGGEGVCWRREWAIELSSWGHRAK